ncbi:hypothetical protein [Endozoicomonas sp. 8E]|uniref:hypothetical protein n=1 Tax=Endozoicomonas sp. 8E TaxID=3035692 RepID=UPI002938CFAD|nr:hypothetical protein [Endozoicomonas sp. 8E]WOG27110.1 hypothetical protein P6910_21545 [Endozoicomonas sp. 8E]
MTRLLPESEDGNRSPQQHQHTLGLNCFVYSCHGVCEFRPSADSREPAEWSLDSVDSLCPHLFNRDCYNCITYFDYKDHAQALSAHRIRDHKRQKICDETLVGSDGQQRPCGSICKNSKALSLHKKSHRKRQRVNVNRDNDSVLKKVKK